MGLAVLALAVLGGCSDAPTETVSAGAPTGPAVETNPAQDPGYVDMDDVEADLVARGTSERILYAIDEPDVFADVAAGDGEYVWTSPEFPSSLLEVPTAVATEVVLIDGTADDVSYRITKADSVDEDSSVVEITATVRGARGDAARLVVPFFEIQDPSEELE